jgi:hypothetical protein
MTVAAATPEDPDELPGPSEAGVSPVRPRLAEAIGEVFDVEYFREIANQVKDASKGVHVEVEVDCRHCGKPTRKKVIAQIPDFPRIVSAVKDLLEQVEGRAGSADVAEAGLTLVVERKWPT